MSKIKFSSAVKALLLLALLASTFAVSGGHAYAQGSPVKGAVYTISNDAGGNAVLVFDRHQDGSLTAAGSVATNGLGTGSGLGSQGALALSTFNQYLFVVNAGSSEISSFSVLTANGANPRLHLIGKIGSGGTMPISLTSYNDLLYVLNAGGNGNISGFRVGPTGLLSPIIGSTEALSGGATGPAEVSFSRNGAFLVVTEKNTGMIDSYPVNGAGRALPGSAHPSVGVTPFGFGFAHDNQLIVSNAAGGGANASSVSSYVLRPDGSLPVKSGAVADGQTAACWIAVTGSGNYAYTTNAGSGTISGYTVGAGGALTLLGANGGVVASPGATSHLTDVAFSQFYTFLYTLANGTQTIYGYTTNADGSLTPAGSAASLPATAVGIAAY